MKYAAYPTARRYREGNSNAYAYTYSDLRWPADEKQVFYVVPSFTLLESYILLVVKASNVLCQGV